MPAQLPDRFWAKVDKTGDCWLWMASCFKAGYGQFGAGQYAHRFSWELHNGAIPVGKFVCHKCDVRACVNPDHLFLGAQADNVADMDRKGRRRTVPSQGARNGGSKLSPEDVELMRLTFETLPVSRTALARAFGVSGTQAGKIVAGKAWF